MECFSQGVGFGILIVWSLILGGGLIALLVRGFRRLAVQKISVKKK